jgi:hypothetical protein
MNNQIQEQKKRLRVLIKDRGLYLMFGPLINLLLAEFAAYQALYAFFKSPFVVVGSKYFALGLLYPVVIAVPLLLLILRRNPFSFGFFYFLIFLSIGNILAKSELFYAFLDALYVLNFGDLASYLNSIFSSSKHIFILDLLLNIVWLFVLSQLIWISMEKGREMEERGMAARNLVIFQWGFAFISTYLIFLLYPAIFGFSIAVDNIPLIFTGIAGIAIFITSALVLSR